MSAPVGRCYPLAGSKGSMLFLAGKERIIRDIEVIRYGAFSHHLFGELE